MTEELESQDSPEGGAIAPEVTTETTTEQPAEEASLRDELKAAMKEARERDESGRFVKKATAEPEIKPTAESPVAAAPATLETPQKVAAPQSWRAEVKAEWDKLPPAVQAEISRREADIHKSLTAQDEDRGIGKAIKSMVEPHMPLINRLGGNPYQVLNNALTALHLLHNGNEAQKKDLLHQLARDAGVDLQTQNSSGQQFVDPALETLQQRLDRLERERQQEIQARQQSEQATLSQQIEKFRTEPGHEHFESVRAEMAALLQGGRAQTLQEAYEMAVWAKPEIRSTLLDAQIAEREAKRLAEKKAAAEAARKAGSSIKGNPGGAVPSTAPDRSLRDDLKAALRAATG